MENEFVCQYCGYISHTVQAHAKHEKYCNSNPGRSKFKTKEIKKELCPYCEQQIWCGAFNKHIEICKQRKIKRIYYKSPTTEQDMQQWIEEQHTCEKCGKIMTEFFGSGRYCSRQCSNSRDNIDYIRVSKSLYKFYKNKCQKEYEELGTLPEKFCKACGKKLLRRNKSGYCSECIRSATDRKEIRVQAGKRGLDTKRKNGTLVGWQKRNVQSYSESFWQTVLDNNHIEYLGPNYPVKKADGKNNYFLDFFIEQPNRKIDLEIDGKQHKYPDRAQKDKIRDEYLTSIGFIVYRVDWNEIKSEQGQLKMKEKIETFIDFLHST